MAHSACTQATYVGNSISEPPTPLLVCCKDSLWYGRIKHSKFCGSTSIHFVSKAWTYKPILKITLLGFNPALSSFDFYGLEQLDVFFYRWRYGKGVKLLNRVFWQGRTSLSNMSLEKLRHKFLLIYTFTVPLPNLEALECTEMKLLNQ